MDLYLDAKETELLTGLLQRCLDDLRREIHHTDTRAFKEALRADEALLSGLLEKVKTYTVMGI
jgi:hypothetical protein